MIDQVTELLERATESGHPPAASACAIVDGRVVHESAHGGAATGSVFDVASVTKIAATTLVIATSIARGELSLDTPVARHLPRFAVHGKDQITVRELLGHRSGLPAWKPFFVEVMNDPDTRALFDRDATPSERSWRLARERVIDGALDAPLVHPGQRVYSDLGFIALGALAEAITRSRLDVLARDRIFAPLGLAGDLGFADLAAPSWIADRHVLPTGRTRPREPAPGQEQLYRVPPQAPRDEAGQVDDDNAFAMGGVAGHAGVFATARALAALGHHVLEELEGTGPLAIGGALRELEPIDPAETGPARSLGFDRPAAEGSSAGALLGRRGPRGAIGHLGFTGCSLWIDLDRRLSVALLTNRTYPGRAHVGPIRALRPAFHDALCRALD